VWLSAGFETVDVEPSYLQEAAAGVGGGDDTVLEAGKETPCLRRIYIETIVLPRQARDKHRESSTTNRRFLRRGCGCDCGRYGNAGLEGAGRLAREYAARAAAAEPGVCGQGGNTAGCG